MKVSVIVPMYNIEKYLKECLDSLEKQTLLDMEVILVDDGATDHTAEIAQEYADRYPQKFILLHKKNGGLSDARNYAIPYVRGKYLSFLDSDDWVEPSLYEKLADVMDKEKCDVCVTDIEYWYQDPARRTIMKGLTDWQADTINKEAMLSPMFAWNKMYKAELFTKEGGYRYPLHTWYEDNPVSTMIFAKAEKIGYLSECLIHYRQREGSIMSSTSDPRVEQIFSVMAMVRENFENEGLSEKYHDELEYLHIEHLRLYGMFRFIRSDQWKKYYQMSQDVMMTCYPDWKKNRYLCNLSRKNQLFLKYYSLADAWAFNRMIRKRG